MSNLFNLSSLEGYGPFKADVFDDSCFKKDKSNIKSSYTDVYFTVVLGKHNGSNINDATNLINKIWCNQSSKHNSNNISIIKFAFSDWRTSLKTIRTSLLVQVPFIGLTPSLQNYTFDIQFLGFDFALKDFVLSDSPFSLLFRIHVYGEEYKKIRENGYFYLKGDLEVFEFSYNNPEKISEFVINELYYHNNSTDIDIKIF